MIKLFINQNKQLVDENGAKTMNKPLVFLGEIAQIELNFCDSTVAGLAPLDMSYISSAIAAIDTDFDTTTAPMCHNDDVDCSQAASGIFNISLDTNTEQFLSKVQGKQNVAATFEFRGKNSSDETVYVIQLPVNCTGAIYLGNS